MSPTTSRLFPLAPLVIGAAFVPAALAMDREQVVAQGSDWRAVATEADRDRLRHWREVWVDALDQAGRDHGAALAAGGILFEPDAALTGMDPPAGDYDCRTVKLGRSAQDRRIEGRPDYVAYPVDHCRIATEAGRLVFTKLTGAQRPVGTVFPDNGRRMIFLGTMMLGDEGQALRYSRDRERDLIGILERIGPERWRLVFPRPARESLLDVIELTPRR